MSKNSIGGFFVDLAMKIDKNSFESGNKAIDGIGNGLNKITGLARNTAVVLSTMAIAGGVAASQEYKVAAAIGVTTEQLNKWKAAASIAGVSASGLTNSLSKLGYVLNHTDINGNGLGKYAEQLSFLGMSVSDLIGMNPSDAYQSIIETAQKKINAGKDETRIYNIVGDILGSEGQGLLIELTRRQQSISDALNVAGRTQYETNSSINKGANFISEVKITSESAKSISKLLGEEIGGELTPIMKDINKWLNGHGNEIKTFIQETAKGIGVLIELSRPLIETLARVLGSSVSATSYMLQGIEAWKNGDKKKADELFENASRGLAAGVISLTGINGQEAVQKGKIQGEINQELLRLIVAKGGKLNKLGQFSKADKLNFNEDIPPELQAAINSIPGGKNNFKTYIQDGIIRPNGQITQVAPDDWVFAARNVSDLAAAFIPQGMGNGGNAQFIINQSFTINGAKDTAQTIKQQAFNGTRSALFESMTQSGRRLQQMSGTR